MHRVSADGKSMETLATGFRNPNGMGVSPDGRVVTVAPQQGTRTRRPSSRRSIPEDITDTAVPDPDASAGLRRAALLDSAWRGQFEWIPGLGAGGTMGRFGRADAASALGTPGMMLALRDTGGGNAGPALQGAVVPLPVKFPQRPQPGILPSEGRFLFVAGSTGLADERCEGRIASARPVHRKAWRCRSGFRSGPRTGATFSIPVDRATAEDPGSYGFKQWNYRYAEAYGSKDWSVANPDREGRDDVAVKSVRLQPDGRTVSVEIPGLQPVMQWELRYNVDAADHGRPLRGSVGHDQRNPAVETALHPQRQISRGSHPRERRATAPG